MAGKMQGVTLVADWAPNRGSSWARKTSKAAKPIWAARCGKTRDRDPGITTLPTPGPDEVLLEVKACGICGSDVPWPRWKKWLYLYPGLTGLPSYLGHEFSA